MMNVSVSSALDLRPVVSAFPLLGNYRRSGPYGSGHINDTYCVEFDQAGRLVRYLFQRINNQVFRDIPALMANIARVTSHTASRVAIECEDASRRSLTLVHACNGKPYHRDGKGGWWRCYLFIEGARTHDIIESERQACEAARAFGTFQNMLADLPGERLFETIPHFHDTRQRLANMLTALKADPLRRAKEAEAEIAFVLEREAMAARLLKLWEAGLIPERVTHNDTKLNNVMIDDRTQTGVCVIDLDTVMPGLALYDFGDMVRSATNAAAEDERDLNKVHCRPAIFEALVEGYLSSARPFLNETEIEHLAFSGRLITLEIGVRFLTDYLDGDRYFKIKRPEHNLDRARNQFALLRSMESQKEMHERIVRKHAR